MPVQAMFDDFDSDDSEFSETDVSLRRAGHRSHIRQRSHSRHRHREPREPREPRVFLEPVQSHIYRSASTGGGRRRERSPIPTAINIFNEQGLRAENKPQSRRVQQRFEEKHSHRHNHFDDEIVHAPLAPSRRERAASSVSRDHSPFHRDPELMMLERSDIRQDMDIWKHQQEIERLEREIRKTREKVKARERVVVDPHHAHDVRIIKDEAESYEAELAERLHRLQRMERKNEAEEAERKAEERYQLKRLAAEKRAAEEEEEVKHKLQEERLRDIARMQDEKAQREKLMKEEKWKELARLKEEQEERDKLIREEKWKEMARRKEEEEEREKLIQEIRDEDMRKAKEAEEKRKKEIAMKAAAVEEWKLEQERIKQRQAEEAAKKAKEFRDHLRSLGYSEEEVDAIINKKSEEKKKEEAKKEEKKKEEKKEEEKKDGKLTWIKVHHKHLLPETLIHFNLPWDWDEHDTNYIIIKRWISEDFQEQLFAHTRSIRERKVIAETSHSMTELRVNDRNKDKMYLVRKKSPRGRVRLWT